jgi:hypothetical protein
MMDQLIPFHKPNKNNEEREDDGLANSSNQTPYIFLSLHRIDDPPSLQRGQSPLY